MTDVAPRTIRRVVIGASMHAEIRAALHALRPSLELTGARFNDITAQDLAQADCYVGFKRPPVETMGAVRWVHCTGAGVDGWLQPDNAEHALRANVVLTRTPELFGPRIAEWVLARAFAFTQELFALREAQNRGEWMSREPASLRGARVLVVGTGDIGTNVAALFAGLGCHVTGVSRTGGEAAAPFSGRATVAELGGLVGDAEWIVLTVPLTPESRHLFDRAMLARCRGAVLMNVGRGGVVEEAALPEALERGWLRGAALDVFETEPLPASSPLWKDPRVIVSPHISGITTVDGVVHGFLECLDAFARGETPKWVVDRANGY